MGHSFIIIVHFFLSSSLCIPVVCFMSFHHHFYISFLSSFLPCLLSILLVFIHLSFPLYSLQETDCQLVTAGQLISVAETQTQTHSQLITEPVRHNSTSLSLPSCTTDTHKQKSAEIFKPPSSPLYQRSCYWHGMMTTMNDGKTLRFLSKKYEEFHVGVF